MKRAMWLVPALVAAVLILPAGAAHASCNEPIPLEQALEGAHAVFVGTVTATDFDGRVATVQVDEVWSGTVGSQVTISGGGEISYLKQAEAQGQGTFTSVDRIYEAGGRYLFLPYAFEADTFMDNQCSNTQLYGPDLDAFRPADARAVEPPGPDRGPLIWVGLAAVGTLVAAGAIVLLARRRVAAPVA